MFTPFHAIDNPLKNEPCFSGEDRSVRRKYDGVTWLKIRLRFFDGVFGIGSGLHMK